MLNIGYNKRGLYAATLTIVVIIIGVVSYNIYLISKENSVALENIGTRASSSLNSFYESEKIKYYIDESAKYSAFNATFLMGENGGIYDKENCMQNNYVVFDENCKLNIKEDFKKYFNDKFNEYLKDYNIKAEDFELTLNEEFKGISKKNLELSVGGVLSNEIKFNIKEVDDKTAKTILEKIQPYMEIIRKYSTEYNVPESLIIAVIAQESSGNINIISGTNCYGLMQICPEPHPNYFNGRNCNGENAIDSVDCNIKAGVEILSRYYIQYSNGIPENLIRNYCKNEDYIKRYSKYTSWSAALRAYNGLGCEGEFADTDYVEKILKWSSLFGGEIIEEFDVKKIGSYYFKPEFLVDLNYNLDDFNQAKEVAENWVNGNCNENQENCIMAGYYIERKIVENLMVFEFKSKEKLYGIKEVVIKFALPIKT